MQPIETFLSSLHNSLRVDRYSGDAAQYNELPADKRISIFGLLDVN